MSRLLFLGVGAALMYLADPQSGRQRRNGLKSQAQLARERLQRHTEVLVHDAAERTAGALVATRQWVQDRDRAPVTVAMRRAALSAAEPWRQPEWASSQRVTAGALGAGFAAYGYLRGGLRGMLLCLLGGSLLARATTNAGIAPFPVPANDELQRMENVIEGATPVRGTTTVRPLQNGHGLVQG